MIELFSKTKQKYFFNSITGCSGYFPLIMPNYQIEQIKNEIEKQKRNKLLKNKILDGCESCQNECFFSFSLCNCND